MSQFTDTVETFVDDRNGNMVGSLGGGQWTVDGLGWKSAIGMVSQPQSGQKRRYAENSTAKSLKIRQKSVTCKLR